MKSKRVSNTQMPWEVAAYCRQAIEADADKPSTTTIARAVFGQYLPGWETTGRNAPGALHAWSRDFFARDLGLGEIEREAPAALHRWARDHLRYIREPRTEYVAGLAYTYMLRAGDCDDHTVAIGTIALSVGLPTWVAWRWTGPNSAHVYICVGQDWVPREPARPIWNIDPWLEHPQRDLGEGVDGLELDANGNNKHLFRCRLR